MKKGMMRLGLSLMIVLGFWANRLPAQEMLLVVPTIPYEPAMHPPANYPYLARPQPPRSESTLHRVLNGHGMACGVDWYSMPCGNFHYELNFVFGSCRYFFGDSCPSCKSTPQ